MFSSKDLLFAKKSGNYQVKNSLRFRSSASAYLSRTQGAATNGFIWTWSAWVKRGSLGANQVLFCAGAPTNTQGVQFIAADTIQIFRYTGAYTVQLDTTQVFRDTSAWYHLVVANDVTQATASNRIKFYVNGAQVTSFTTAIYPAQNTQYEVNNNGQAATIGRYSASAASQFDGYQAEVNFIDGQALSPSSFGTNDPATGVWVAKQYTGTYGTNGFYLPFSAAATSSYAGAFTGTNANGIYSPANSAFTFTGDFTVEFFAKLNSTATTQKALFAIGPDGGGLVITLDSSTQKLYPYYNSVGNVISSSALTPNVYYHIAWVRNGATNTLYLNGVSQGTYSFSGTVNSGAVRVGIGNYSGTGTVFDAFNGNISNARIVKGTAVYTSNFSVPTSNLTAITNTQLLTLQNATLVDNSANAFTMTNTGPISITSDTPFIQSSVGSDASGNGNNWLLNNINVTSSGTTYDAMIDAPNIYASSATQGVGNYAVLSPLDINASNTQRPTDGNLTYPVSSAVQYSARGTIFVTSGKWYAEFTISSSAAIVAVVNSSAVLYGYTATNGIFTSTTSIFNNGTQVQSGLAAFAANDVIGVAFDADANTVQFYKNGSTYGTAVTISAFSGPFTFQTGANGAVCTINVNFGQQPFRGMYVSGSGSSFVGNGSPPSGFKSLNTSNLPTPTITNGAQYMAATTYTATGTTPQTISNGTNSGNNPLGTTFQPDLVWTKTRSTTGGNLFIDAVRGASLYLVSNLTNAEATDANYLTSFNANGFSLGSTNYTSGTTMVGWQWKAGGTGVSNTSGSITSTVSANASAGFSVVTWTGTGATGTIGHGLGVAPQFIIVKARSASGEDWYCYHVSLGASARIQLNTTAAQTTGSSVWNSTSPTSTVFSIGSGNPNTSTVTYVAYCFAPVASYSSFGSYVGNGSSDGPMVWTGFRPRFVLLKISSGTIGSWYIFDTSRATYNVIGLGLAADLSNAEFGATATNIDALSNGFKLRTTSTELNGSASTYIYAAFAENPFKYSNAR